ncbi:MAG: TolC family protein [Proteobacteria bacterium]|nr:TolC family protein [Pseudomonadota bacterium]
MTGRTALLACCLFVVTSAVWARDVVVGVLGDGLQTRAVIPVELLQKEFSDLMQPEFNVRMPADKQLNGGWTVDGVRSALDELLNDPEVEVIIANGVVASHLAGHWGKLKKPVIAPIVIDAKLQGFAEPREALRSNFVYLSSFHSVDDDLSLIRNAVPFSHLVVLVQRVTLEGVPAIQAMTERLRQNRDFEVSVIAVEDSVDDLIGQIPKETDMVYVAPLFRLDDQQMRYLAQRLIARKIPSFSLLGKLEVEMGLMMSATGLTTDHTRLARRIALTLQALLLHEADPAPRSPDIGASRLVINMATARAIGVLPRWAVLTGAEKLFDNEYDNARPLTLLGAMQGAMQHNLDLKAARFDIDVAEARVKEARGALLPQLSVSATGIQLNEEQASPLFRSETTLSAEFEASQLIYSDDASAALAISRYLRDSSDLVFKSRALDTLQAGAVSYLELLSANAVEQVRQSNLEVTRLNLELAKARAAIGFSGRSDVLRWESQIAADMQDLLAAEAARRAAAIEVSRVMHLPQNFGFITADPGLDQAMSQVQDERFQTFVGNPVVWDVFQKFVVASALELSPELQAARNLVLAQERQVLADKRDFYVPDISLRGTSSHVIDRGGIGSDSNPASMLGIDRADDNWTVLLEARLPIFSGGARKAILAQSRHEARKFKVQEAAVAEAVEARVRTMLQLARQSYASIELSQNAAAAARGSLALVTDSYSRGAVSITDLIDAQNAALSAGLDAAVSLYSFVIDFMNLLRAQSNFELIMDPLAWQEWLNALEQYYREQGVAPLRGG